MTVEDSAAETAQGNKARFWAQKALSVREGIVMHIRSGEMTKDPETGERPWGNITEHCLVQVVRVETLGKWLELPNFLIAAMKMGAVLDDYHKKQEITATRQANQAGTSPLSAVRSEQKKGEDLLKDAAFSSRVIRLANSAGVDAPQLSEAQRILDQETLSDDDLAYLIVHYVDDCSVGTDWVIPSQVETGGRRVNVIDYRMQQNKAKIDYKIISQEINNELSSHPKLGKMNSFDAASFVSHEIEKILAKRIAEKKGEFIDPLTIPELVDQKIKEAIENFGAIS